jgi:hypothetical protein
MRTVRHKVQHFTATELARDIVIMSNGSRFLALARLALLGAVHGTCIRVVSGAPAALSAYRLDAQ